MIFTFSAASRGRTHGALKALMIFLLCISLFSLQSCQKQEQSVPESPTLKSGSLATVTVPRDETTWGKGPWKVYAGKASIVVDQPTGYPTVNRTECFTLNLVNGDGSGVNEVSGVTVTIDGVTMITSTDLRKKSFISLQVCGKSQNTNMKVTVAAKGKSTNYVTVWIDWPVIPTNPDKFYDKDGVEYPTKQIGALTWMTRNLAYLPKDPISNQPFPNSINDDSFTLPRYYVYDYYPGSGVQPTSTGNYMNYGVLYNQPAAVAACPDGWRLPTLDVWTYICKTLSTTYTSIENNNAGIAMKSTSGWDLSPYGGINGTNTSGFTGLPGGTAVGGSSASGFGYFQSLKYEGYWWSGTTFPFNGQTWCYQASLNSDNNILRIASGTYLNWGQSVRYVKGTLPTP